MPIQGASSNPSPDDYAHKHESTSGVQNLDDFVTVNNFESLNETEIDWKNLEKEVSRFDHLDSQSTKYLNALTKIVKSARPERSVPELRLLEKLNSLLREFTRNIGEDDKGLTREISNFIYKEKISQFRSDEETYAGKRVSTIPNSRLFISESQHPFDVKELENMMNNTGELTNPNTRCLFTPNDLEELKNFKSIESHPVFRKLVDPNEFSSHLRSLTKLISPETRENITPIRDAFFKRENPDNIAQDLLDYFNGLDTTEQEALNEISMDHPLHTPLKEVLENISNGDYCEGFESYFDQLWIKIH